MFTRVVPFFETMRLRAKTVQFLKTHPGQVWALADALQALWANTMNRGNVSINRGKCRCAHMVRFEMCSYGALFEARCAHMVRF